MARKNNKICYYAVHKGRKPWVDNDWKTCELQVYKYKSSVYKKFSTRAQAELFVQKSNKSYS